VRLVWFECQTAFTMRKRLASWDGGVASNRVAWHHLFK
jgi:hypothetical protein